MPANPRKRKKKEHVCICSDPRNLHPILVTLCHFHMAHTNNRLLSAFQNAADNIAHPDIYVVSGEFRERFRQFLESVRADDAKAISELERMFGQ